MPLGRVLQTCNELALSCPSMCLKLHPLPFNIHVLHSPHESTMCVSILPPLMIHDITVLDIHTLSSLSTKRNEGNGHISLYKHLILIVLLNIKINNLNSATSRQATHVVVVVVDNTIYQQKLECPNGYIVSDHCVTMLVIYIIQNSFIVCGFIWNKDSDPHPFNEMKINFVMIEK